jgi:antitoxin PrlF
VNVRPTLEIEATITDRGQTTVPAAIRKMLGVKKGPIVFKGLADGTVIIEARQEEKEEDPAIAKFLEFLEKDIAENPQRLQPLTREMLDEINDLVGDLDIDLDASLDDD